MNKLNIEKMIIHAMENLDDNHKIVKNNEIDSKYFGYISAFGPSVIQSGLLQTIAFYCSKSEDKKHIIDLMEETLKKAKLIETTKDLLTYVRETLNSKEFANRSVLKNKILDSCIACKLAMKTYKKKDD